MPINALSQFGIHQFDQQKMQKSLPVPVYKRWLDALEHRGTLDRSTADSIAFAMKEWAIELGCTHYSHWFQPLTGQTAEKHDSFIDRDDTGVAITSFSGKSLIKGDTDGSSFPNGGLRATFEARGYTYWDISSPAFIRDHVLCIPTVFVSFHGEHLDMKGPLLRSLASLSKSAVRVLHEIGYKDVTDVKIMSGLEQEYFLVDREMFLSRKDLLLTGRTIIGKSSPRGQEFEDHYFGSIVGRVQKFMDEVNLELWKLGIYAKVEHNEVAPGQYEISPIFTDANSAVDQNQIMMDVLKKTARKHDLECLLHEKPFKGINGSGKHNNWSLVTNEGTNLFEAGDNPAENLSFLLFVAATIQGIDKYPELIRLSSSGPGNDHRLGANEAPPAIVSVFLGSTIEQVMMSMIELPSSSPVRNGKSSFTPVSTLAYMPKDNSDRNRTSPFAFTGNRFELRMMGSSISPSLSNTVIAAILSESLDNMVDELARADSGEKFSTGIKIVQRIMRDHHRVIFGGDGYAKEWVIEAKRRGLPNLPSFVESISSLVDNKALQLFKQFDIFTPSELHARTEILYEQYIKTIRVEVVTLLEMVRREIFPQITTTLLEWNALQHISYYVHQSDVLVGLIGKIEPLLASLEKDLVIALNVESVHDRGLLLRRVVVPQIDACREVIDAIEVVLPSKRYPFPDYTQLLHMRD